MFRGHEVHRVASNATLTFEHTYTWWGEAPNIVSSCISNKV